jgi:hypothetical protein
MKNLSTLSKSALILCAALVAKNAEATTYIASQHGKFTDEKIWHPNYPGSNIAANDSVIISAQVVLNTALSIAGVLTIEKGASFQGNKDVAINQSGKLVNKGNTVVRRLLNEGRLDNQLVFETMLEVENHGTINTSSATIAGTSLLNQNGVLSGTQGSYFSNSTIISSPASIYEKGVKVFEASYTNPMAEIDEALFCSSTLNAFALGKQSVRIEINHLGKEKFSSIVLEKSTDGKYFQPIAEIELKNNKYSIEDMQVNSDQTFYRAFAYDADGRKYRFPETFVKNITEGETLSMASRISY